MSRSLKIGLGLIVTCAGFFITQMILGSKYWIGGLITGTASAPFIINAREQARQARLPVSTITTLSPSLESSYVALAQTHTDHTQHLPANSCSANP